MGQSCEQGLGKHFHPCSRFRTAHNLHNLHLQFWEEPTLKVKAAKENILCQKKESIVKAKWNGLQQSQAVPEGLHPLNTFNTCEQWLTDLPVGMELKAKEEEEKVI